MELLVRSKLTFPFYRNYLQYSIRAFTAIKPIDETSETSIEHFSQFFASNQKGYSQVKPSVKKRAVRSVPDYELFLRPPCTTGLSVSVGCTNFCRYCFVENKANEMGIPWRMKNLPLGPILEKASHMRGEIVQLPVTHDVTPNNVNECMAVIEVLLQHNQVVIVTKPYESCILKITERFSEQAKSNQMLRFRLSITTDDENLLRKWEPGAPSYEERIHVLRYLHAEGWKVGLSIAPMLDIQNVVAMYNNLEKYCNDTIYVAKMAEGEKLVTRGSLKAEDIALLHSQCADLSLLKSVSSQLKKSSLFAPKFCIHEYDQWAFGSETEYHKALKQANIAADV